jgi:hypothetical protein
MPVTAGAHARLGVMILVDDLGVAGGSRASWGRVAGDWLLMGWVPAGE